MTRTVPGLRGALGAVALLFALVLPGAGVEVRAAEASDYAYLFLQGKLTDGRGRRPLAGARIELTAEAGSFEAVTDDKGVFRFDRLPVTSYAVEVTSPDGLPIQSIQRLDLDDTGRAVLRLRAGRKGEGRSIPGLAIRPVDKNVEVDVPNLPTHWRKLWKELAIFLGIALPLAF
jgi:hypothetical protein